MLKNEDEEGEENEEQGREAGQQSSRAEQALGARAAAAVAMGNAGGERRARQLATGNLAALCLHKARRPSAPFQMPLASRGVL